jgi:hypothetical protein
MSDMLKKIAKHCAWCERKIRGAVYGVGAKLTPGVMIPEGAAILPLKYPVSGKIMYASVVGTDSPAKRAGYDICFILCSRHCAGQLRQASLTEVERFLDCN